MALTGFRQRSLRELDRPAKRRAVAEATRGHFLNRLRQWASLEQAGRLQSLRDWATEVKDRALDQHELYLRQFTLAVQERGGHVHFAATPADAVDHVLAIARRHGAQLVVKSKSMVTEEIHLTPALKAAGIETVETDLGEYIIQLAGQPPVHIVGPAIHMTRHEVADLFAQHHGRPMPSDPQQLTAFARQVLREKFLAADIGVTGANFAIAETGSIVLFTNEGNGRMVTTLPRVLISVVGLEKLVPTWADLEPLLTLLPRSATGQNLTSYVTAITGPRRDGEADGPEECHVVVVDAGRSRLLGTDYQPALRCIRCGACLNACPVFRQSTGHAYGGPYSGPIGVVITPLLGGLDQHGDLLDACSVCGACTEACPVQIPLHELILNLRAERAERPQHARERWLFRVWAWAWSSGRRYRLSAWLVRLVASPLAHGGWLTWLPPPLNAWGAGRAFPAPAAMPLHRRWASLAREVGTGEQP